MSSRPSFLHKSLMPCSVTLPRLSFSVLIIVSSRRLLSSSSARPKALALTPRLLIPSPLMLMPMPTPPSARSPRAAGESKFIIPGTLRGAGDENAGRCFCGVFVEGVGVAMPSVSYRRR